MRLLGRADVIFKRSYSKDSVPSFVPINKFYPLAPNYACLNIATEKALFSFPERIRKRLGGHINSYKCFERGDFNVNDSKYKILFLTRLWDPDSEEVRDEKKREDRQKINRFRIMTARLLKTEFGKKALVGVHHDSYAERIAHDLIVSNTYTWKPRYLRMMKKTPICISTLGLHESNGWRFGEYLASNRAIVTEAPVYDIPFSKSGCNYLEFADPETCVQIVSGLLDDPLRTETLMKNNRKYYFEHLRPDKVILDSLSIAAGIEMENLLID